jgi:large subunit ribosomal protein L30
MSKVKIRQIRSTNECEESQRATVRALGLRRIRDTVVHEDSPQIRGMIKKVNHLVEVEDVAD